MHPDFAGDIAPSGQLSAVKINYDHVLRPHHALAHGGGGTKNAVFIQSDREVSVHGRHVSAFVHHSAKLNNLTPK
jgi:hypothetical protein